MCYFLRLSYLYWQAMKGIAVEVFDAEWQGTVKTIVDLMVVEQHHDKSSPYRYVELARNGLGVPSSYTGMTWTAFRPSDDPCTYPYLIPANAFAYTTLGYAQEILATLPNANLQLVSQIQTLR